jgi:hypothetical protein
MKHQVIVLAAMTAFLFASACRPSKSGDAGGDKPELPTYKKVDPGAPLGPYKDALIQIEGRISQIPWQHIIGAPEGYGEIYYFDLQGGGQIVIYAKTPIVCDGPLTVWGRVVEIQGQSKRPDTKAQVSEYHITVDRWECRR